MLEENQLATTPTTSPPQLAQTIITPTMTDVPPATPPPEPPPPKVNDVSDPYGPISAASSTAQSAYSAAPAVTYSSNPIASSETLESPTNQPTSPPAQTAFLPPTPPVLPQRYDSWAHIFDRFHPKLLAQIAGILIVVIGGLVFGISKLTQPPASNLAQQATTDSTTASNDLLSAKNSTGTLSINYNTVVSNGKTLTASEIVAGSKNKKLLLTGDVQATGTIYSSDGTTSLSNGGLVINGATICDADGCKPNTNVTPAPASNGSGTTTTTPTCAYGNCVSLQSSAPGTSETGNIRVSGKVTAGTFSGSGASVTNVNAASLQGNNAAYFTNASNLASGTVDAARIASSSISYAKLNLSADIVNSDISASAAIAYSKLNLAGAITNSDIANAAAIAYSKLNLAGNIANADISNAAAIAYSKLNLAGNIANADISNAAAIA
ncbi:hypothetical protein HY380_00535, partial [Candidatus Saccharibacteria bacterium]|nr:hypothetical protein [Candidatus Saccharibacteria bacterium]